MIKVLFGQILEKTINKLIMLNPAILQKLTPHEGKVLMLEILQWQQRYYLFMQQKKVYVYSSFDAVPNTSIRGSLLALLQQALQKKLTTQDVTIEGDMDFAQDIYYVIQNLDIDWEEWLSFLTGDVIAHEFGENVKKFKQIGQGWLQRCTQDMLEYIQEEKKFVPTREEIEDFYEEIAVIRNDVARLQARWDSFEGKAE